MDSSSRLRMGLDFRLWSVFVSSSKYPQFSEILRTTRENSKENNYSDLRNLFRSIPDNPKREISLASLIRQPTTLRKTLLGEVACWAAYALLRLTRFVIYYLNH